MTKKGTPKRKEIQKSVSKSVRKRHRAETRFKLYGYMATIFAFLFLGSLLYSIIEKGYSAFKTTYIELPVFLDESIIDPDGTRDGKVIQNANFSKLLRNSIKESFPEVSGRRELGKLYALFSSDAKYDVRQYVLNNLGQVGSTKKIWLLASSDADMYHKDRIDSSVKQRLRKFKDNQIEWFEQLKQEDRVKFEFNKNFFTKGDSGSPETAGILVSMTGSLLIIIACMALSLPLGVLTGIYLEEFAKKNKITSMIEVNINNLAAVPSIVFGLLGLAVYIQIFGIPRSASLAGGFTLALMILPTIVITTRTALRAVPPSIRDAAYGLGASKMQTTLHHTLPLAVPGIMTGTILGIARALGETAPLLMIGMMAFVVDVPKGFLDPASAMPVQIYLWSDKPEMGFVEKTSAAILVLLVILALANMLAIFLRKKYEKRW